LKINKSKTIEYLLSASKKGHTPSMEILLNDKTHYSTSPYSSSYYASYTTCKQWEYALAISKAGAYHKLPSMELSGYHWHQSIPHCKDFFEESLKHDTKYLFKFSVFYKLNDIKYKTYIDMCIDNKICLAKALEYYTNNNDKIEQIVDIGIKTEDQTIIGYAIKLYKNDAQKMDKLVDIGIKTCDKNIIEHIIINNKTNQVTIDLFDKLLQNGYGFSGCYYIFYAIDGHELYDIVFPLLSKYINHPKQKENFNMLLTRKFDVEYALKHSDYLTSNNAHKLNVMYKAYVQLSKYNVQIEQGMCELCKQIELLSLTNKDKCINCL
jgi:hypothetical protein